MTHGACWRANDSSQTAHGPTTEPPSISKSRPLTHPWISSHRNNNKTQNAQIVLGHVSPTPYVAAAAARAVNGQTINDKIATAAGRAAHEGAKPLSQTAYKVRLVEVAVKRAVLTAAGARRYWEA